MQRKKSIDDADRPLAELHSRRITLEDGRYMVFYTFDQDAKAAEGGVTAEESAAESEKDV